MTGSRTTDPSRAARLRRRPVVGRDRRGTRSRSTASGPDRGHVHRRARSTARGTLENVVGVRPGTEIGSIVIVAPRDALGSPATACAVGHRHADRARARPRGRDAQRTRRARLDQRQRRGPPAPSGWPPALAGPVDAVVVLGDLAGAHVHAADRHPVVHAPDRRAAGAAQHARLGAGGTAAPDAGFTGLGGQFAHLAFPFTPGSRPRSAPRGIPAVLLSLSGERGPSADATVDRHRRSSPRSAAPCSTTISALDSGQTLPAPSAYVLLDGKVVPGWAISPVRAVADRAGAADHDRRRRPGPAARAHPSGARSPWCSPRRSRSCCASAMVLLARLIGLIPAAPPGPCRGGRGAAGQWGRSASHRDGARPRRRVGRRAGAGAAAADAHAHVTASSGGAGSDGALAGAARGDVLVTLRRSGSTTRSRRCCWCRRCTCGCGRSARTCACRCRCAGADRARDRPGGAAGRGYYAIELGYGPIGVVWEAVAAARRAWRSSSLAALEWSVVLGCLVSAVTLSLLAARGRASCPSRSPSRSGHLRRPGLARRHQIRVAPLTLRRAYETAPLPAPSRRS